MNYQAFVKRVYLILKTKWILFALRGKLFSFSSFEIVNNLRKNIDFKTIIDVGANGGQFAKACAEFFKDATIYSFEPLPEQFENLLSLKTKFKKIELYNMALGNESGEIQFNKNEYGHISSVLEVNPNNKHGAYKKSESKKIKVRIEKLDNIIKQDFCVYPTLLKLDVQGYELEVLKGSKTMLIQSIDYIVLEVNLESLYTEQPSFTKLNNFLNENKFELDGMLDFNLGNDFKYIEVDLLYKKIAE